MNKNAVEIERKFLVKWDVFIDPINRDEAANESSVGAKQSPTILKLTQGYLTKNEHGSVRIRIEDDGYLRVAYLMSKTKVDDMTNNETVDEISVENAETLIKQFSISVIRKKRHIVYEHGKKWEVDVFIEPSGLVLAEIELTSPDEVVILPKWVDREVTGDPQYYNANM